MRSLAKDGWNQGQRFNFRGIDAVMNAVGPALRTHSVIVSPVAVSERRETYNTAKGTAMTSTIVNVTYRAFASDGSYFEGQSIGEAADAGDKSSTKAMSVAYRTFLLQALCLPTDDDDPDASSHERAPVENPEAKQQAFKDKAKALLVRDIGVKSGEDVEILMEWLGLDPSITTASIKENWKHAAELCQAIAGKSASVMPANMLAEAKKAKGLEAAVDEAFPVTEPTE